MKTNKGGYKAMLRDRVPRTTDLALKWCKAKTKWVDYVYKNYIWFCKDNELRKQMTRNILGLSKANRVFIFGSTIDWFNLTKEEYQYWFEVNNWVNWFEKNLLSIADMYETLIIYRGEDPEYVKTYICKAKLNNWPEIWQNKLYDYLIDHIKRYYV